MVGTMQSSQKRGVSSSGGGSHGPPSKRHADLATMEDGDSVGGDPKKKALAGVEAGERGEPGGDGTSRGREAGGSAKVTGMFFSGRAMRSLGLFLRVFLNGRTKNYQQIDRPHTSREGERGRAVRGTAVDCSCVSGGCLFPCPTTTTARCSFVALLIE